MTLGSLQGGMNSRSTREASLNIEKDKRAKQSSAYWGRERERARRRAATLLSIIEGGARRKESKEKERERVRTQLELKTKET